MYKYEKDLTDNISIDFSKLNVKGSNKSLNKASQHGLVKPQILVELKKSLRLGAGISQ